MKTTIDPVLVVVLTFIVLVVQVSAIVGREMVTETTPPETTALQVEARDPAADSLDVIQDTPGDVYLQGSNVGVQ